MTTTTNITETANIVMQTITTPLEFVLQQPDLVNFLAVKSPYSHVAIYDKLDEFIPFREKYDDGEDQTKFIYKSLQVAREICTFYGIIPLCVNNCKGSIENIKSFINDNIYIKSEEERGYYIDVLNKILNINGDYMNLHNLQQNDVLKLANYDSSHSDLILSIIDNVSNCMLGKCLGLNNIHYCEKFKFDEYGNIIDGPFVIMNKIYS